MTSTLEKEIRLRPIEESDRPFLMQVYAGTRAEEMSLTGWSDEQKRQFLVMQFQAQHSYYQENYKEATFDIILYQEIPVGRLYVAEWPTELRIIDIALLPQYRNQGIGSYFLAQLMQRAEAVGKGVSIHVDQSNAARNLYKRFGFEKIGEHSFYDLMAWSPEES